MGEGDERATPDDRQTPVVLFAVLVGGVGAPGLAGEVLASVEDIEGGAPVRRGCGGLAGQGEVGILSDDVAEEE